jgi:Holliday junction resolvasome RuvABC endonuclease subunit
MRILGIDPSLTNLGFVVLDGDESGKKTILEKGKLQTVPTDGLPLQRYLLQANGIAALIKKYDIKHVASEAPFFGDFNTEILYGLQSFLHFTYWVHKVNVVIISPTQLKSYACPDVAGKVFKSDMVKAARKDLGMRENERLANDVADAYWVSKLGMRWWLFYGNKLPVEFLTEKEKDIFTFKHTFSRGKKKGATEYKGIVYRKNELYYLYDELPVPGLQFLGE